MKDIGASIAGLVAIGVAIGGVVPPAGAQMIARLPDPATARQPQSDLVAAYKMAEGYDPQLRGAAAERRVNLATASQALTQYLPQASFQVTSVPNENTTRQIVSVSQPVFSVDRYAALRERGPRKTFAEATFDVAEHSLATRLFTEVGAYIKAVESAKLNKSKIDAFQQQSIRAERLYKNGLGTVTDARDIEVRYEQAVANQFVLDSEERAAASRVEAITGKPVQHGDFEIPDKPGTIEMDTFDNLLQRQNESNPSVIAARATERIGKWEALRAKGSLLPTIGMSGVYTRSRGVSDSYFGVAVQAPLAPGGLFQLRSANATAERTSEQRRQAEIQAKVDLGRFYEMVDGGQKALAANASAISAAELSVEANTKSYEGGVRTSVDVVNAIQTLYEVKNGYVNSRVQLATNLLNLMLLSGASAEVSLEATQQFLFGK